MLNHSGIDALESAVFHAENVHVDMFFLFGIDIDRCLRARKQHPRLTLAMSEASSDTLEDDGVLSCNTWRGTEVRRLVVEALTHIVVCSW